MPDVPSVHLCNMLVGCQGVEQLGGQDSWCNWGGTAKVGARKSLLFLESSLVVKIKNTWTFLLLLVVS